MPNWKALAVILLILILQPCGANRTRSEPITDFGHRVAQSVPLFRGVDTQLSTSVSAQPCKGHAEQPHCLRGGYGNPQ